ncbi:MAG: mitochondrial fission ELM1 family protein [Proteobacteria bacterium]|nr:mitochondrial fission ELM1 family protein [Pseudomonadota bacterium]
MKGADCWVLTDGKAGTENQCLGLADALALAVTVKRLAPRAPWRWAPASLWTLPWGEIPLALFHGDDPLAPPWPRLLIASGRPSVGPALAIRRASKGATFCVQLQDPRVSPRHFDLVAAPRHDHLAGPNVLATRGALHRVTAAKLEQAAAHFGPRYAHLPRPRVAVLIGGTSKHYRLTASVAERLGRDLRTLGGAAGAGLMVTASRRTGSDNEKTLRMALEGAACEFWDGEGENPYLGFLALADHIIVSEDSVSMTSEAASTGKPVYTIALEGGAPKFREFHESLAADGVTRPFTGALETWSYTALDDTRRVADEVRARLAL